MRYFKQKNYKREATKTKLNLIKIYLKMEVKRKILNPGEDRLGVQKIS